MASMCLAGAACTEPNPCKSTGGVRAGYTLEAAGIRVEIDASPYRFVVRNGAGQTVLASRGAGSGDGYGALGTARGQTIWGSVVSPGYFDFTPVLDPYRDDWRVVGAVQQSPDVIDLDLADARATQCVRVRQSLGSSTLRVEARAEGENPRAVSAAFESPADEAFLGFGERFNRTDQRGRNVFSWAEEGGVGRGEGVPPSDTNPFPNGEEMTYYPVPFFLSTAGYGFWLDTTWRSEFRLATDRPDAWRVWHTGPSLAYEIYLPIEGDARPWPYHVIDRFTAAVGRPMVPPTWAFGPRRRINRGDMQNGVPEIQAMRDLDLAITAVDDSVHFLPAGVDVGNEATLAAWVAEAAALGYRVAGYYNPYFSTSDTSPLAPLVAEGVAKGYFLRDDVGELSQVWLVSGTLQTVNSVDFTNPDAVAWYGKEFDRALALGYSGWMYDFGEYVQPNVVASNGMTGEELHNLYPVLYQRAAYEALEAGPRRGDWMTFVRSGYTGASAFAPLVWSGDPAASFDPADGLPSMIPAGLNLGISGAPHFGGDIGGFHCVADGTAAADEELFARWIELGAMSTNMQDQDACVAGTGAGVKADIFTAPAAQQAWKIYARLHTRLFPYLYALAAEAHATGSPVMRQLFLEHPDRVDLAQIADAFYFGPAILVAPIITRGARSRTLELPAGRYLRWPDGQLVDGGRVVSLDAPLENLPLLLRDGYLVPLLDERIDTLAAESNPDVIGPADVADVYDVVGLLSREVGSASFRLADGGTLVARLTGAWAPPPQLVPASTADEVRDCAGCYFVEDLGGGLQRVRLRAPADATSIDAGGLRLEAATGRATRWDLYLLP